MKKSMIIIVIIASIFAFIPKDTYALSNNNSILIIDKTTDNITDWTKDYDQPDQTCEGDDSILGNPQDENSVAWLLDKILSYATVAGMLLVIVLSTIDFVSVIVSGNDDAMAKAWKKFGMRLVLAGLLFFVPTITNALLDLFGLTSESTCGIKQ